MKIENYRNNETSWLAQMALAYLRGHHETIVDRTWNGEEYDIHIELKRYKNGRESGYIFYIPIPAYLSRTGESVQRNWAVFEHRMADALCVLTADTERPTVANMWKGRRNTSDIDAVYRCSDVYRCAVDVAEAMESFIKDYYRARPVPCGQTEMDVDIYENEVDARRAALLYQRENGGELKVGVTTQDSDFHGRICGVYNSFIVDLGDSHEEFGYNYKEL